jgi:LmbE family N-acetylglucosaminyl deacetylase
MALTIGQLAKSTGIGARTMTVQEQQWEHPALLIDITQTMELKLKAITCHASLVNDVDAVFARLRRRFAALGTGTDYAYAEGFDHVVLPG